MKWTFSSYHRDCAAWRKVLVFQRNIRECSIGHYFTMLSLVEQSFPARTACHSDCMSHPHQRRARASFQVVRFYFILLGIVHGAFSYIWVALREYMSTLPYEKCCGRDALFAQNRVWFRAPYDYRCTIIWVRASSFAHSFGISLAY